MIIDQFSVFFDDADAAAAMTSDVVNFQPYAGREDPIYISLLAKGANAASIVVTVQQSADNATFTDVGSVTVTKAENMAELATIRLPVAVKDKYVRLSAAVTGTVAGTTLFAGVTRDHVALYDKGLYIDGGKVVA
ncbi:hypothetical protein LJC46_04185 [Desulfovibrio sp. OttesenSCG-928-G15]|nr:hypothetical protein [Desulfovibrio sp. OttesenSCG-928-G15]